MPPRNAAAAAAVASSSSSDSDDELLGTAISDDDEPRSRRERLERAADPARQQKFVPTHLQEVHDEQGRRRFHGAFTGGFSAGYYNSVGSEEGWAPSEWRSSRSERVQRREQTADDFMDDEDRAAMARGQPQIATHAEYSSRSVTKSFIDR